MAKKINVRLILQLYADGMIQIEIAETRHMSRTSVSVVLQIARKKGITYDNIVRMSDDELYRLFFPGRQLSEDIYESNPKLCVNCFR